MDDLTVEEEVLMAISQVLQDDTGERKVFLTEPKLRGLKLAIVKVYNYSLSHQHH